MKNEKIIASWNKILPDEAAVERMRSKIVEYQRSYIRKDRETMKRLVPITACFVFIIAVTAFIGVQHNWFGAKSYTVTLDNGEKLVYGNSSPKISADFCYFYEVKDRALTTDELHTLFPTMNNITENSLPYATFKADTGEMLRLETTFDDIHIHLAKSGLPVTDTIIDGKKSTADINGITVKTGYFVTRANGKGIKTAIFFAEYDINNTTIYAELAGNERNSEQLSEKLSDTVYSMITDNAPDISAIKYE